MINFHVLDIIIFHVCYISEKNHPIDPPRVRGDPFDIPLPESVGCCLKMKDGVSHVYASPEDMACDKALELPYSDLKSFLADQNLMYAFISDGPL